MKLNPHQSGWDRGLMIAAAALALLWCAGLFGRGYWTPDEPREAALAASMAAHLQPLPTLAGVRFAEKPPLSYWLAGLSQRLFGASAAVTRAPQLLYAILAFMAVLRLARRLRRADPAARTAAWVAAMIFATGALAYQAQIWLDTDALLLAGVCVALAGMYDALSAPDAAALARGERLRGYLTMHAGLTLAFFAKNFAAWLVPVLAFLCFIAWERRWREFARWELYAGALLPISCIGVWLAAVAAQPDGAQSLRILFWNNLFGRALPVAVAVGENYSSGHANSPGKYLFELPLYLLPWTFVGAGALMAAWRGACDAGPHRGAWRFALGAAAPGLLLLSLATTARGIYAAPCMVGFALLIALWAAENIQARTALALTSVLIALLATAVLALTVALQWTVERAGWPVFLPSALACAAVIAWSLRSWLPAGRAAPAQLLRLASAWCLLLSLGALSLSGAVNRSQDIGALAARVAQSAGPGPLLLWNPDETTLAWAQLYLPAGSWGAIAANDAASAAILAQRLSTTPATVVVSMIPGHGWSWAKWRQYLRPHTATTHLSMMSMTQAGAGRALVAAGLTATTRVERPGGRGYFLWRRARAPVTADRP